MKFSKKGIKFLLLKIVSIIFFTLLYWIIEHYIERNPKKKATLYDCLFYSFITQTTIGYGIPESITDSKSVLTKGVNLLQMISIFIILSLQL